MSVGIRVEHWTKMGYTIRSQILKKYLHRRNSQAQNLFTFFRNAFKNDMNVSADFPKILKRVPSQSETISEIYLIILYTFNATLSLSRKQDKRGFGCAKLFLHFFSINFSYFNFQIQSFWPRTKRTYYNICYVNWMAKIKALTPISFWSFRFSMLIIGFKYLRLVLLD